MDFDIIDCELKFDFLLKTNLKTLLVLLSNYLFIILEKAQLLAILAWKKRLCTPFFVNKLKQRRGRSNVTLYEQRYTTSASQSSPPSHSRLPPDGHEFPSSYSEGLHDKIERLAQYSLRQEVSESPSPKVSSVGKVESTGSHSKLSDVSSKSSSSSLSSSDSRSISRWRRQDERSERSVRDKIAMFSTEEKDHQSKPKTRKIDRSESVSSSCMKRSLTEDDVRIEPGVKDVKLIKDSPMGKSSVRKQGKPSVYSSMINVHSSSDSKENVKPASSESDVRGKYISKLNNSKAHPVNLKTKKQVDPEKDEGVSGLNSRSQSLIDIGKPTRMKRHSVGAFDRPSVYKYGIEKPEERERRTSLNNLIEQRRKSMSKLRGLVIPETRARESNESRLPLDLPRISSHTSQTFKTMSLPREETKAANLYKADSISSIDSCSSSTSRHSSTPGSLSNSKGITKLSPAHTRKHSFGNSKGDSLPPLCSRSVRNQSPVSDFSGSSSTLTTISPQRSFDRSGTPTSEMSFESESRYSSERSSYSRTPTLKSFDSRLNNKNEDSDNDSAVSSTQSSFSQSLSPRASPMPDHEDQDDRHSPTRSLRPRHSPQSSFDDLDQKRVLKSGSIEAENRRNILKSAKCSSGRSSDEQSTPEIVRKFSKDRTPEPFANKLDSDLKEGQRKHYLRRNESIDSSSSISSIDSSRRNSKDSVIHVSLKQSDAKLGSDTLYDKDAFKETPVRVAYLNEIVDNYEELPDEKGTIFAEVPIQTDFSPQDQINNRERSPTNDKKWNELEQKYTSLKNEQERIEDKISKYITSSDNSPSDKYRSNFKTKKSDFKELANKWKQRAEEDSSSCQPQVAQNLNKIAIKKDDMNVSSTTEVKRLTRTEKLEISSFTPSLENSSFYEAREERPNTLNLPRIDIPDRKFSMPEYGTSLKLREKDGDIPSRPTSLIEGTKAMETLQQEGQYLTPLSPSISTDSREDLLDSSESSLSRTGSKEVLDAFSKSGINNSLSPKMSEIMRAFERHDITSKGLGDSHPRMSSLDSTASDDGSQGGCGILYGSVSSLASGQRDQFGSITSLSSSTSIISPQELAQLIEEANHSLEESGTPSHEIVVVVLHREIVGQGSIGITLAGGADYETKEITVSVSIFS
ncbi:hypothetical protein Avbf_10357 [Armadillidium vulgare]|nr:hypothetical protein Avbf_10357 [Armadillidium vulgare]